MHLSKQSIVDLENVIDTSALVKIDSLLIENNEIRGVDEDRSIVVLSKVRVPDIDNKKMALKRLSSLKKHLTIIKADENYDIQTVEASEKPDDIRKLKFNSKQIKSEFFAANANVVKPPVAVNDEALWLVVIDKDIIPNVIQGSALFKSENLILTSKESGEVYIEFIDQIEGNFSIKVAESAMWIPEDKPIEKQVFVNYYLSRSLLPLISTVATDSNIELIICRRGTAKLIVNGLEFSALPRTGS